MGETGKHSRRWRGWLGVVLTGLVHSLPLAGQMEERRRYALAGEHLVIHCEEGQRSLASVLLAGGEEQCEDLARRLKVALPRRAHVYLFDDVAAFRRAGEERWDPWVAGIAWPERSLIWMPPALTLAESRRVLAHELAHLFIAEVAGHQPLPRWLEEGAAQYLAGEINWSTRERALRAMTREGWIPLSRLEHTFPSDADQAARAYAEAALFLEFWVQWRGEGDASLLRLVQAVKETGSLSAALQQVGGWSVEGLERVWRQDLRHRWRWARWWLQWEIWIWAGLLPAVVVWSYGRRRRRWQRYWEETEGEEAIRPSPPD